MTSAATYRRAFMALVNDLCKELSYPEREDEFRNDEMLVMEMKLEDIPFCVSHSLVHAPERILIEAGFGVLPQERRTDVLYRLMHLNRELSEAGAASFALGDGEEEVVYTHAAALQGATGSTLLTTMTEITWRAEYWRSTYFLEQEKPGSTGSFDERLISLA